MTLFQFLGSHFFLVNALTLTEDTLGGWELNLHYNLVIEWDPGFGFQKYPPWNYSRWKFLLGKI